MTSEKNSARVRSIRDQLSAIRRQLVQLTRELQAAGGKLAPQDLTEILTDTDRLVGEVVDLTAAIFGTTRTESQDGSEGET
jgi:hypothetical protein